MKSLRFLIPLALFAVLVAFMWRGLSLDPHEVPSPLIGKPAPAFALTRLDDAGATVRRQDMLGKVWLLNVWASWCTACRQEHGTLLQLSRLGAVPIVGLNYKDTRPDGLDWLGRFGNPYAMSAFDQDGRVGIDYGVYGVPETFVIDKQGVIRYKQIGPLTPELLQSRILPLVRQLNG
jgi:cytochrome c biogenesis protein CcmG/thiol:disulfide interchange protein DsbE